MSNSEEHVSTIDEHELTKISTEKSLEEKGTRKLRPKRKSNYSEYFDKPTPSRYQTDSDTEEEDNSHNKRVPFSSLTRQITTRKFSVDDTLSDQNLLLGLNSKSKKGIQKGNRRRSKSVSRGRKNPNTEEILLESLRREDRSKSIEEITIKIEKEDSQGLSRLAPGPSTSKNPQNKVGNILFSSFKPTSPINFTINLNEGDPKNQSVLTGSSSQPIYKNVFANVTNTSAYLDFASITARNNQKEQWDSQLQKI